VTTAAGVVAGALIVVRGFAAPPQPASVSAATTGITIKPAYAPFLIGIWTTPFLLRW
jgi:hypothetical protein